MVEKLIISEFGAPLEIRYAKGFSCLVYSGEKPSDLESIREDLRKRHLRPMGPKQTYKQVQEQFLYKRTESNLKRVIESRPILIANDVDIHIPGSVFPSGENVSSMEMRKRIFTTDNRSSEDFYERVVMTQYLIEKYGFNWPSTDKERLNKFSPALYLPKILEGMIREDEVVMAAHALDLSGDRIYFNGFFQDFSNCCVFGIRK